MLVQASRWFCTIVVDAWCVAMAIHVVHAGDMRRAVALSFLVSFFMFTFLAVTQEKRLESVFDPRTQSWAFLADAFLIVTFGIAAAGWPASGLRDGWYTQWWYYTLAVVIGVGVTYVYTRMDHKRYMQDHPTALNSPTKIWHDYVTVPVFVTVGIVVWLPLMGVASWHRWVILGCIVAWVAAAVLDVTIHKPDVRKQHVAWPLERPYFH